MKHRSLRPKICPPRCVARPEPLCPEPRCRRIGIRRIDRPAHPGHPGHSSKMVNGQDERTFQRRVVRPAGPLRRMHVIRLTMWATASCYHEPVAGLDFRREMASKLHFGSRRFSGIIDGFRHNGRTSGEGERVEIGFEDRCRGAVSGTRGLCRGRGSSASERGRHRRCRCSGRQRGNSPRIGHREASPVRSARPMPAVAWACLSKTTRRFRPRTGATSSNSAPA